MPRSRRRHHSKSRSRSRSHSHDRDREAKRRKIDSIDSPAHKRSVSCESEDITMASVENLTAQSHLETDEKHKETKIKEKKLPEKTIEIVEDEIGCSSENINFGEKSKNSVETNAESPRSTDDVVKDNIEETNLTDKPTCTKQLEKQLSITPKKAMSPRQLQKKLDSEKKRQQKQLEREEREKKKQEEKERLRVEKEKQKQEKEKQKQEKEEMKQKERELKEEQKRKEKEEKEAKRKEKEALEEHKRKEREQEKLRKQQELEEKNKEKQKQEEQKQKAAAAFVNFFVAKKPEMKMEEEKNSIFMPFEVKSDMMLPPARRLPLNEEEKKNLEYFINESDEKVSYLTELKERKKQIRKCEKTWPLEDDVIIIEEDVGESICEDKSKSKKMRAKFLMFRENRRPPYFGTWTKKSNVVKPRRPFEEDKGIFDYEVDSDDDWEEEEQGESLSSDDEDNKENEENDDYEVDNEFFVPHGHLSEDEVDDEVNSKLSPESHKQKLKLLKDEFDQDMQTKTCKMKPRSIGCIWYNKDGSNVDEAIDKHLRPLAMITNGQVIIKKRDLSCQTPSKKYTKELPRELMPAFLKLIHGNTNKRTAVVDDFITYMHNNGYAVDVSKSYLGKQLKHFAQWKKCTEEGPKLNRFCWCVEDDAKKKYNID